jgi:hypothetical protein
MKTVPSREFPADVDTKSFDLPDFGGIADMSKQFIMTGESGYEKALGLMKLLQLGAANIIKFMSEEDVQGLVEDLDKVVSSMDADEPFREEWRSVVEDINRWKELKGLGREEEAQASYQAALRRLNSLILQLGIKESADRTRLVVRRSWESRAPENRPAADNILSEMAAKTLKNADAAYKEHDYEKAGILYSLAGELVGRSDECGEEGECVLTLRGIVLTRREAAEKLGDRKNIRQYQAAEKARAGADKYLEGKDYRRASELYLQAALLYEQSKRGEIGNRQGALKTPRGLPGLNSEARRPGSPCAR